MENPEKVDSVFVSGDAAAPRAEDPDNGLVYLAGKPVAISETPPN